MLEDYNRIPSPIRKAMPLSLKLFPTLEGISILACVVSFIWLLIQGAWWTIFYGVCALILFQTIIGIILLPEMLLHHLIPTAEGGSKIKKIFIEIISLTYLWLGLGLWSFLVVSRMLYRAGDINQTSIYLWAYSISIIPITVMINRDEISKISGITNIFLFLNIAFLLLGFTKGWGEVLLWERAAFIFLGLLPFLIIALYRYHKQILKIQKDYFG